MKRFITSVAVALSLVMSAIPVAGDDFDYYDYSWDFSWWDVPTYEAPAWEAPTYEVSTWDYDTPWWDAPVWDLPAWDAPTWDVPTWEAPNYDAPAFEVPEGIYLVTETYVGDVVTVDGLLTTYETETTSYTPGSYARELESVGTGQASALDGEAFNGRGTLSGGEQVAGTYYENFVLTDHGFVSVSVVFFQDDSELARLVERRTEEAVPLLGGPGPQAGSPENLVSAPQFSGGADVVPIDWLGGGDLWEEVPSAPSGPSSAPIATVDVSFAVLPGGSAVNAVETLRGRRATLWPRATINGIPVSPLSWRLVSGIASIATPAGVGGEPFVGRWDQLAPPGSAYLLQFAVRLAVPGDAVPRDVMTNVEVIVVSPALAR